MSLWHLIIYNLGGLYYIENKKYEERYDNAGLLKHKNRVNVPTLPVKYPIKIFLETGTLKGPLGSTIKEVFNIISDRYILLDKIPKSDDYEIVSIYGERCDMNTALNNTLVIPFLRDLFLSRIDNFKVNNNYPKRFFIRRNNPSNTSTYNTKKIRTILNECEFVENLKKYDIHPIYLEELNFKEKISLFSDAEFVMSTNSSALTCLLWCNKNVKVIEIINKNIACGRGEHYKILCDTLKLEYYRYSDINDDDNGNFVIPNDDKIYNFIDSIVTWLDIMSDT